MLQPKYGFLLSLALTLPACAGGHASMRGSVVMKMNATDAHVCLGEGEVQVGDKVDLIHHVCEPLSGKSAASERCKPQLVSTGQVVEVLNSHYSLVRFPSGVTLNEGDTVEKHK